MSVLAVVLSVNAATGSASAPLTVTQLLEQGAPASPVANTYVTGYIVGYVPDKYLAEAVFDVPSDPTVIPTNLLLAASSGEDVVDYCIPVQLPAGDVRNALNLGTNPKNLDRKVTLLGTNEKYFGVNGLKSVTAYAFDGEQLKEPEPTPGPVITTVTSLNETFASIPATWNNVAVAGDQTFYATSFSGVPYAAVSGYKGTQPPYDAWLVSPGIEIEKCESKTLTFRTQVNGYGSTTSDFKAYVLTDRDPSKATRTELKAAFAVAPESGYSSWVESGNLDLSAYKGTIYVAFNYTAAQDANYATWCVTDVKLNAAAAPVPPVSEKGTKENPLTIAELIANPCPDKDAGESGWFVKGYIVGCVNGNNVSAAEFGLPSVELKTNILVGPTADCQDVALCIPVQLPIGNVRTALNLTENPSNLGKAVTLEGTYERYCGAPGLRQVVSYELSGGGDVPTPPTPAPAIYAGLETSSEGWNEVYASPLPEGLSYVWKWDEKYGYKASGYANNTTYAVEATAVSPAIDLANYKDIKVEFSHAGNYFASPETAQKECQLLVREVGGDWAAQTIEGWFSSWTFVDASAAVNGFDGKKVELGLRYTSTAEKAGTWEVKNLRVTGTDNSGVRTVLSGAPFAVRVENGSIIAPEGAEVYSLSGMKSGRTGLAKGIYLVRHEGKTVKVVVK